MRVLLDTNIIIHREANTVINKEIGVLFGWLDRLHADKCVHPLSIAEIQKHKDPKVVATFEAKLKSYTVLKTIAPEAPQITALRAGDKNANDKNDTSLLQEVFAKRVDLLLTEDRNIHAKARGLGIGDRVFTIDDFLEKVTAENPELATYKVLAVKTEHFGNITLADPFFDSFRRDYIDFDAWFNRKADEIAYLCKPDAEGTLAFLYLKLEDEKEAYGDIAPAFSAKRRLKIGTFKVAMNGYKLGERFLKIAFDNALRLGAQEIYLTIFRKDADQERLVALLQDWGFKYHGKKRSKYGEEDVFVRDFSPVADRANPAAHYPFMAKAARKYIVPIYPAYHTELLPDSILNTESPKEFVDNRPNRNAIKKVYISRSLNRDLRPGDIIVFYRTKDGGAAHHTSVATSLGIVESIATGIPNEEEFIRLCRKRSVFSDAELKTHWNYRQWDRPFVVNFLFTHSFSKRPNLATLKDEGVILEAPRGFEPLSDAAFVKLLTIAHADNRLIVD
jgi:predicted nucleic acid-binding protein